MTMREALEILETIRGLGADLMVAPDGSLKVKPASRVPDDLIDRATAHAAELRMLVAPAAGSAQTESATPGVSCRRCCGSGREPSAREMLDAPGGLGWTLRALMWPEDQISLLRDELRPDECVIAARWGGLDLINAAGGRRTINCLRR
jgi:hypothetical protein